MYTYFINASCFTWFLRCFIPCQFIALTSDFVWYILSLLQNYNWHWNDPFDYSSTEYPIHCSVLGHTRCYAALPHSQHHTATSQSLSRNIPRQHQMTSSKMVVNVLLITTSSVAIFVENTFSNGYAHGSEICKSAPLQKSIFMIHQVWLVAYCSTHYHVVTWYIPKIFLGIMKPQLIDNQDYFCLSY